MKDGGLCDDSGDDGNSPACSEETWLAGKDEIISFSAGGDPVLFNN